MADYLLRADETNYPGLGNWGDWEPLIEDEPKTARYGAARTPPKNNINDNGGNNNDGKILHKAIEDYARGHYKKSLDKLNEIMQNLDDKATYKKAEIYRNIALSNLGLRDNNKALENYTLYLKTCVSLDNHYLISCAAYFLMNMYDILFENKINGEGDYQNLINKYREYDELRQKMKRNKSKINYKSKQLFNDAIKIHNKILRDASVSNSIKIDNHLIIADLFIVLRQYNNAFKSCDHADELAKNDNSHFTKLILYKRYQCYDEKRDFANAKKYLQNYRELCKDNNMLKAKADFLLNNLRKIVKKNNPLQKSVKVNSDIKKPKENSMSADSNNKKTKTKKSVKKENDSSPILLKKNISNWKKNNDEAIKLLANLNVLGAIKIHEIQLKNLTSDRNINKMTKQLHSSIINLSLCLHKNKKYLETIDYLKRLLIRKNITGEEKYFAFYYIIDSYERLLFSERKKGNIISISIARNYKNQLDIYEKKRSELQKTEIKFTNLMGNNIHINKTSLNQARKTSNERIILHNLLALGNMYIATNQYSLAIKEFKQCLDKTKNQLNKKKLKSQLLLTLFKCYRELNNDDEAFKYIKEYLECVKTSSNVTAICVAYETIINFTGENGVGVYLSDYASQYKLFLNTNQDILGLEYVKKYIPNGLVKPKGKARKANVCRRRTAYKSMGNKIRPKKKLSKPKKVQGQKPGEKPAK